MADQASTAPRRRLVKPSPPPEATTNPNPEQERIDRTLAKKGHAAPSLAVVPTLNGLPAAEDLLRAWLPLWAKAAFSLGGPPLNTGAERLHRQAEIVPPLPDPLQQRGRFKPPVTTDPQFQGVTRNMYQREPRKRAELMSFEFIRTLPARLVAKVERQRRIAFSAWRKLYDAEGGKGRIQAFIAWQSRQDLIAKMGFAAANAAGMPEVAAVGRYRNVAEDLAVISANLSLASFFDERLRQHAALTDCEPGFMLPAVMRARLAATVGQIQADLDEIRAGLGALTDAREWKPLLDWKPEGGAAAEADAEKLELDFQRTAFETWEAVLPDEARIQAQQLIKARLKKCRLGYLEDEIPWVRIADTWAAECNGYALAYKIRQLTRALGQAETTARSNFPKGSKEQRLAMSKAMFKAEDEAAEYGKQLAFLRDLQKSGGRYYA